MLPFLKLEKQTISRLEPDFLRQLYGLACACHIHSTYSSSVLFSPKGTTSLLLLSDRTARQGRTFLPKLGMGSSFYALGLV